jgi:vacuolar protein sorting-associated protein 35
MQDLTYRNAQRALECLQRALKLADACTSANPEDIYLFVDLLDHYVFFFEKKCPVISHAYITGLVALIREHVSNLGGSLGVANPVIRDAREQYLDIVRSIKAKKEDPETAEQFAPVNTD